MSEFELQVRVRALLLCYSLPRMVREYYRDPQHRAEFNKWHLEKYGEPYAWVSIEITEDEQ